MLTDVLDSLELQFSQADIELFRSMSAREQIRFIVSFYKKIQDTFKEVKKITSQLNDPDLDIDGIKDDYEESLINLVYENHSLNATEEDFALFFEESKQHGIDFIQVIKEGKNIEYEHHNLLRMSQFYFKAEFYKQLYALMVEYNQSESRWNLFLHWESLVFNIKETRNVVSNDRCSSEYLENFYVPVNYETLKETEEFLSQYLDKADIKNLLSVTCTNLFIYLESFLSIFTFNFYDWYSLNFKSAKDFRLLIKNYFLIQENDGLASDTYPYIGLYNRYQFGGSHYTTKSKHIFQLLIAIANKIKNDSKKEDFSFFEVNYFIDTILNSDPITRQSSDDLLYNTTAFKDLWSFGAKYNYQFDFTPFTEQVNLESNNLRNLKEGKFISDLFVIANKYITNNHEVPPSLRQFIDDGMQYPEFQKIFYDFVNQNKNTDYFNYFSCFSLNGLCRILLPIAQRLRDELFIEVSSELNWERDFNKANDHINQIIFELDGEFQPLLKNYFNEHYSIDLMNKAFSAFVDKIAEREIKNEKELTTLDAIEKIKKYVADMANNQQKIILKDFVDLYMVKNVTPTSSIRSKEEGFIYNTLMFFFSNYYENFHNTLTEAYKEREIAKAEAKNLLIEKESLKYKVVEVQILNILSTLNEPFQSIHSDKNQSDIQI